MQRPLAHQQHTPTQQIAQRPLRLRHDVAFGQDAQPKQARQMPGIGLIVRVLETGILRDGARMGQTDIEPGLHQAIHQPIPVVGRFHHASCQFISIRLQAVLDR